MSSKKQIRWFSLIPGVLLVVAGLIAFFNPVGSYLTVTVFIGILILVASIAFVINYFLGFKKEHSSSVVLLVMGIIGILIALFMLFNTFFAIKILSIITGIWIIVSAISRFMYAFKAKDVRKKSFIFSIIMGIISLIIGVMFILNLSFGATTIVYFLGIYFVFAGVMFIIHSFD